MNLYFSVGLVFFVSIVYTYICFGILTLKWPGLMRFYSEIEDNQPSFKTTKHQRSRLEYKIRIVVIIIMLSSVIEHVLSIIKGYVFSQNCSKINNPIIAYYRKTMPHIFNVFDFNPFLAAIVAILNFIFAMIWNGMDLFIIVMAIGVSAKFKHLNEILLKNKDKNKAIEFWLEYREHYRNLTNLCEVVDDAICSITLICFANNLFFICVQLIYSLE